MRDFLHWVGPWALRPSQTFQHSKGMRQKVDFLEELTECKSGNHFVKHNLQVGRCYFVAVAFGNSLAKTQLLLGSWPLYRPWKQLATVTVFWMHNHNQTVILYCSLNTLNTVISHTGERCLRQVGSDSTPSYGFRCVYCTHHWNVKTRRGRFSWWSFALYCVRLLKLLVELLAWVLLKSVQ